MIKQICPHCLKPVSVPDDAAGKDATCPECGKAFPVQAKYNPVVAPAPPPASPPAPAAPTPRTAHPEPVAMSTVQPSTDRPAPPPGYVPPMSTQLEPPLPAPPPVPAVPPGYSRSVGVTFHPKVIAWLPAICLTLTLLATCFSWVGVYIGGHALYAQGPWKAMFGYVTRDQTLEAAVRDQIPEKGAWLDRVKSDWELILPYLVCLILATIFAWAERGVASLDKTRLAPPLRWLPAVWPYRIVVITVLATIAFILIASQVLNGFGLQRAARQQVAEKFAELRKAAGSSESALATVQYNEEQELAKYNLERTTWLYLGLGLHLLAVIAILGRVGLDQRGNKPPPRIVIQY